MRTHLFLCELGIAGNCEICGQKYDHPNHKTPLGNNSFDTLHMPEDERIEMIAEHARQGSVAVILEFGIGKVERYIRKMKERHPDVRLVSRTLGPAPMVETVQFGPKTQA